MSAQSRRCSLSIRKDKKPGPCWVGLVLAFCLGISFGAGLGCCFAIVRVILDDKIGKNHLSMQ